jgi:molybdopterin converting factor small subunit
MTGLPIDLGERDGEGRPVTVLFFAGAREATGTPSATFASAGNTVAQLVGALVATYGPDLDRVLGACAIWVNGAAAAPSYLLCEGDEVAVLPPVSGGADSSL